MSIRAPEVRILVCGTADRGDDGASLAAVAHVLPSLPDEIRGRLEIRRCQQLDVTDLIDVGPTESVIVIDTVVGVEPGGVVTIPLEELARRPGGVAPRSSHSLSIDDALLIAEVVRGTLPSGVFVGVGGKWFGYGPRFSRAVKASLDDYAAAIRRAIEELLAPITV